MSLSSSPAPASTTAFEPTINHILSLPNLLQPISPPHAALHLARLRLLYSIPADGQSFSDASSSSSSSSGIRGKLTVGRWCSHCGGLRKGMGGAQRGGRGQDKDKEKEDKTKAIRERARKRVRELSNLTEDEKEEKKMARKLEIAGAVQKRRQPAECTTCGAVYTRPKPDKKTLSEFPSSRKTRKQATEAKAEEAAKSLALKAEVEAAGKIESQVQPPQTLLSHPAFSHIPSSPPNLPTHPPPPPAKNPAGSTSAFIDVTKKKKKTKKSGLSKLLAENRERNESAKGAGMWGLG
ncbi:hypothetical protein C366_05061 [Cryptococcus neoformans Tu401-1]|nr:hypothetical protein C365_04773 [Cryptococcus neoformans var. grubii Bt85]OXG14066.1 hypothetical protein C366_05061 [Cryptococcus neoformans var. grubii Tu401-1]OXM77485.1 hypothetical protein C364_05048 [Cryptococcus neoformans var. grubii Bt63]